MLYHIYVVNALQSFPDSDRQRVSQTLEHLLPYLEPDKFAVVGGLAIRYFAALHNQPYPDRPFNDLDIIVNGLETVSPDITDHFKIEHFHHNPQEYYLAVVDPATRVKVDIFRWPVVEPTVTEIPFGRQQLPIQSIEDQLAKTILDTTKVLRGEIIDPKQLSDASLLQAYANPTQTTHIFSQLYGSQQPTFISSKEALDAAQETARQHPERVKKKPFHKTLPYQCLECIVDSRYSLTPLSEIHQILGYIE